MIYQPIMSFRHACDAVPVSRRTLQALPPHPVDKWDALREIAVARAHFDLSDRDLAVLQALLSFHPGTKLDDPTRIVVFPSNATLCARLNGMPCSTMRRHLARLIDAGLVTRRDSPNGKRYRRALGQTFGFDLSPLAVRFNDIRRLADGVRLEQGRIQALREQIHLIRRDLMALMTPDDAVVSGIIVASTKALRRKLTADQLQELAVQMALAVDKAVDARRIADDPGSSDAQNEQHHYRTDKTIPDSDICAEQTEPDLNLADVMAVCGEIQSLSPEPIRDWHMLVQASDKVRPMMGICAQTWDQAIERMGRIAAAVTLAAILQRFDQIRSPGAYLRTLSVSAMRHQLSLTAVMRSITARKFTAVNPA